MKNLILIIILSITLSQLKAQRYLNYDTIHKHEISVSVLPIIDVFGGSFNRHSQYTNFNFSYKCYFKNKFVFRTAIIFFPNTAQLSYGDALHIYDRTVGLKNVFSVTNSFRSTKTQLNFGLEKIFKVNRLMQGFGIEAFVNNWTERFSKKYDYRYIGVSPNTSLASGDTTNYSVDSLGFHSSYNYIGVGLQAFYSLRYQICKRWYISSTIGPSINCIFSSGSRYNNSTNETKNTNSVFFVFPNVGFISDISICFRL